MKTTLLLIASLTSCIIGYNVYEFASTHSIKATFTIKDKLEVKLCNSNYFLVNFYDQYKSSVEIFYKTWPNEPERYGNSFVLGHHPNSIMPGITYWFLLEPSLVVTGSVILWPRQCHTIQHDIFVQLRHMLMPKTTPSFFLSQEELKTRSEINLAESEIQSFKIRLNLRNDFPWDTNPPQGKFIESNWITNEGDLGNNTAH